MRGTAIGDKGLEKYLGKEVVLRKDGVDYFGLLDIDEDGVYFVLPRTTWRGSRDDGLSCGETLDVAHLDSPGEDEILIKVNDRVGPGKRVDRFRMFSYI